MYDYSSLTFHELTEVSAHYQSEGKFSQAIEPLYHALVHRPNHTQLLRDIASLYDRCGDVERAKLCQRGVIPDSANHQFFRARDWTLITGDSADDTQSRLPAYAAEQHPLQIHSQFGVVSHYPQFRRRYTDCNGSFSSVIKKGRVWFDGVNTIVFDKQERIIDEHTRGNEYLAASTATHTVSVALPGRACFLDAKSASIYYHWLLDVLPKLHIVKASGIALADIDHFIVKARSKFQQDTLTSLGVPASKIVFADRYQHFTADELVVPHLKNDLGKRVYTGLGMGLASWIPTYLRTNLLPSDQPARLSDDHTPKVSDDTASDDKTSPAPTRTTGRRLFISRRNNPTRNIANEADLKPLFDRFNIETVAFESLTVAEQATLMHSADLVIGVHGAGLTNLTFCRPRTTVLEIFGDYIVPCYWALSSLCGLDYNRFMAKPAAPATDTVDHVTATRAQNIEIDITQFTDCLDRLLSAHDNPG